MILAINTASSKTAIAMVSGEKILAENFWDSQNNEAEKLMPEIEKLIKKCGKKFKDIKKVVVVSGPGSFTGLRVGITVANTIAYLNNCELFSLNTFEYFWRLGEDAGECSALLVYAGSKGVYVSLKKDTPDFEKRVVNVLVTDLYDFLKKKKIQKVFGDISSEQKKLLKDIEFIEKEESFGKKILHFDPDEHGENVKIVEALYVKNPEITKSKKKLIN